ncbi:LemA protein [Cardiobacterium hominis]|jgi:membrane protein lemA|uniref:LemA protein n=1 Tax=Cardiobacterium hominis TaxID=2718 RepID=A0A1C3H350_9GAMM|nr:LemA family protein [Cardiobacterium hominis]SAM60468.1 LemA protein [Cardiobacterium hominis]
MIGWIVLALVILAIVASVAIYNRLVNYRNDAKNAFAQIDVQLTRRYDLIPNLVEVARKYLQHEQETLTAVIAARNHAANALKNTEGSGGSTGVGALAAAEHALGARLGGLYATFENYPDLKADNQLAALREEIASTENRIAFSRQHYNDSVTEYNSAIEQFPANIIAGMFGFRVAELLEIEDIADKRQPVQVKFD